jgi:hypothetical protein
MREKMKRNSMKPLRQDMSYCDYSPHSSGIESDMGGPSFRRNFPKQKSDGIANSPSSRNQNPHFEHFFRSPYNFLASPKEISIMRCPIRKSPALVESQMTTHIAVD